ncbi:hypothetical protein JHK86_025041 [Glycine max]|nr:hypothetical protein JHK86_025041 [Glycine max]
MKRGIQIMLHLSGESNIVEFKGAFKDKQSVHVVMKLCAGGELFDRIIAKVHYSETTVGSICRQVVKVVNTCHFMGVIDRDLKLENFLLSSKDGEGLLKATHFGLPVFIEEVVAEYWDNDVVHHRGAFSNGLPLTKIDREMDVASINPGEQAKLLDECCWKWLKRVVCLENFFCRSELNLLVVKSQILARGRGLGTFKSGLKGGVHIVKIDQVYLCEKLSLVNEMYIAITLDRTSVGPNLLSHPLQQLLSCLPPPSSAATMHSYGAVKALVVALEKETMMAKEAKENAVCVLIWLSQKKEEEKAMIGRAGAILHLVKLLERRGIAREEECGDCAVLAVFGGEGE